MVDGRFVHLQLAVKKTWKKDELFQITQLNKIRGANNIDYLLKMLSKFWLFGAIAQLVSTNLFFSCLVEYFSVSEMYLSLALLKPDWQVFSITVTLLSLVMLISPDI